MMMMITMVVMILMIMVMIMTMIKVMIMITVMIMIMMMVMIMVMIMIMVMLMIMVMIMMVVMLVMTKGEQTISAQSSFERVNPMTHVHHRLPHHVEEKYHNWLISCSNEGAHSQWGFRAIRGWCADNEMACFNHHVLFQELGNEPRPTNYSPAAAPCFLVFIIIIIEVIIIIVCDRSIYRLGQQHQVPVFPKRAKV